MDKKETEKYSQDALIDMKVFERMRLFMIQNETIEAECIDNYGAIFRKPFHVFKTF